MQDLDQPYSCEEWGELGISGFPTIMDDGNGNAENSIFNLFHTAQFSVHNHAFIDQNMQVYFKTSQTNGEQIQNTIQEMYNICVDSGECLSEIEPCTLGDFNNDNLVNVVDVVSIVNCILTSENCFLNSQTCVDMNDDGVLNIVDIVILVNFILSD